VPISRPVPPQPASRDSANTLAGRPAVPSVDAYYDFSLKEALGPDVSGAGYWVVVGSRVSFAGRADWSWSGL
jgi:hypothetical protein